MQTDCTIVLEECASVQSGLRALHDRTERTLAHIEDLLRGRSSPSVFDSVANDERRDHGHHLTPLAKIEEDRLLGRCPPIDSAVEPFPSGKTCGRTMLRPIIRRTSCDNGGGPGQRSPTPRPNPKVTFGTREDRTSIGGDIVRDPTFRSPSPTTRVLPARNTMRMPSIAPRLDFRSRSSSNGGCDDGIRSTGGRPLRSSLDLFSGPDRDDVANQMISPDPAMGCGHHVSPDPTATPNETRRSCMSSPMLVWNGAANHALQEAKETFRSCSASPTSMLASSMSLYGRLWTAPRRTDDGSDPTDRFSGLCKSH
jgi:hypothetical protein